MDDLIKRSDTIKEFLLNRNGVRIPFVDCDNFPIEYSLEYICKTLEALPSVQQWIPCSERLPESGRDRIMICLSEVATRKTWFNDIGRVFEGGYNDNGFYVAEQRRFCESGDVIAWMPLPEPYKGEEQ